MSKEANHKNLKVTDKVELNETSGKKFGEFGYPVYGVVFFVDKKRKLAGVRLFNQKDVYLGSCYPKIKEGSSHLDFYDEQGS